MTECLFCKIVAGELPSERVAENDAAYAFKDINPHAPVHVLVVPKVHIATAAHVAPEQADIVGQMILLAQEVADVTGVADSGYRLIMNVGEDAWMSVPHLHLHVLGGQRLAGHLG